MGVYQTSILPWLIHMTMRQRRFAPYRQRLASAAAGRVLEIGFGSGLNVPFYEKASFVIGIDPSLRALRLARQAGGQLRWPVHVLAGVAESLPLRDHCVDSIAIAWTLCSVADVGRVLAEVRRVLVPAGRLLFVEHGRAPEASVARWQNRLTPLWKHLAGGCHLNRPVSSLLEDAGFRIERLTTGYMDGPRPMTFMYEGSARPR
jgi:ubiquinone/menaquinone biosynthesis C-methylase UbiE